MIAKYNTQINIDGKNYPIIDAEAQKNLVYSQNETDTGKIWFDGKKIYRKIVHYGEIIQNEIATIATLNEVDNMISIDGFKTYNVIGETLKRQNNINSTDQLSADYQIFTFFNKETGNLILETGKQIIVNEVYFILEYTKNE